MSISKVIRERIDAMEAGSILTTSDFTDIANLTTVRKCLGRNVSDGLIRRVFDGVYEKPKYSELLGEYLPTNPEKVAYALARAYHWTIAPCGDVALNKLGLSTQVPAVWAFVSDGPYREFQCGNTKITFKHRANRGITALSDATILLVESLRTLGKDHVDYTVIMNLRDKIPEEERKVILNEAKECSEWIYEAIRKVCG